MRWAAIVNPASGRNRNPRSRERLLSALGDLCAEIALTNRPGHATALAASATAFDGVAVAGGDGTLQEVVQGLDLPRQQVAILPSGTGNSLARDLRIDTVETGLRSLRGRTALLDAVEVQVTTTDGVLPPKLSLSNVALGYPAGVTSLANRHLKRLGRWCYPVAAFLCAARSWRGEVRFDRDGEKQAKLLVTGALLSNTRHVGNFRAFPEASPADGRTDFMLLDAGFIRQNLHNLCVLLGSYRIGPALSGQASILSLSLDRASDLMIDGTIFRDTVALRTRVLPSLVACRLPPAVGA